jgi:signal transduction histidine kinase
MLVVRDNGAGFDSQRGEVDNDGFLAPEVTPWSIRERTAALGGELRIRTESGRGAEVSVIIPSGQQSGGRNGSERRMHA